MQMKTGMVTGGCFPPREANEANESCINELLDVYDNVINTCREHMHCVCLGCVYVCSAVIWGVLDLLGEVAAKSSYSNVLVGE